MERALKLNSRNWGALTGVCTSSVSWIRSWSIQTVYRRVPETVQWRMVQASVASSTVYVTVSYTAPARSRRSRTQLLSVMAMGCCIYKRRSGVCRHSQARTTYAQSVGSMPVQPASSTALIQLSVSPIDLCYAQKRNRLQ